MNINSVFEDGVFNPWVSLLDTHVGSSLVPLSVNLVEESHIAGVAVNVWRDDALKALWIVDRLDIGGVVAEKIVVKNDATRLLVCYDYVANLEEDTLDLGVVVIKSLGAIDRTRAFVNLKNIQELPDQLLTFSHQVLFI